MQCWGQSTAVGRNATATTGTWLLSDYLARMSAELIEKMRARVAQCRRLADMINDEYASRVLRQMADEGEADMRKLQAEENGED